VRMSCDASFVDDLVAAAATRATALHLIMLYVRCVCRRSIDLEVQVEGRGSRAARLRGLTRGLATLYWMAGSWELGASSSRDSRTTIRGPARGGAAQEQRHPAC
jgi:hypothetical protein